MHSLAQPQLTLQAGEHLIAVYGTLLGGQGGQERAGVDGKLQWQAACVVRGLLYDLGEYPGLVAGQGTVVGEIYLVPDAATLARLDAYEGFVLDDPASEFVRRRIRLEKPSIDSWIYLYNRSIASRVQVPNGDWGAYHKQRLATTTPFQEG